MFVSTTRAKTVQPVSRQILASSIAPVWPRLLAPPVRRPWWRLTNARIVRARTALLALLTQLETFFVCVHSTTSAPTVNISTFAQLRTAMETVDAF